MVFFVIVRYIMIKFLNMHASVDSLPILSPDDYLYSEYPPNHYGSVSLNHPPTVWTDLENGYGWCDIETEQ